MDIYISVVAKRDPIADCEGFDWDDGNIGKNWPSHQVTDWECEEVFLNQPLVVRSDVGHSLQELRYFALGQSNRGRLLFVAFAVRRRLIRPISVRDMTTREKRAYEFTKEDPDVQG